MTTFLKCTLLRRALLLGALFLSCGARAEPATSQSIEALLELTRTQATLEALYGPMEHMMQQAIQHTAKLKPMSAQQEQAINALPAKFAAVMRDEMSWAKLRPQYVQIYADVFTQDEIDGLVEFYKSPAGQAALDKMPAVLQKSMALSQSLMQALLPKIKAALLEAATTTSPAPQ